MSWARRNATGILVFALALVIFAYGIFRVDWSETPSPGDYIVGFGTIMLAVATILLVRVAARQTDATAALARDASKQTEATIRLARETAKQAELSQSAIDASERPYVIATPHEDHPGGLRLVRNPLEFPDEDKLFYRLWNIGRGPGIVFRVELFDPGANQLLKDLDGHRVVAVDGRADEVGIIDPDAAEGDIPGQFTLLIYYYDGSGRVHETRQVLIRKPKTGYLVPQIYNTRSMPDDGSTPPQAASEDS